MDIKEIIASVFSTAVKVVVAVIAIMYIYKYMGMAYDYGYRLFSEKPVSEGSGIVVTVTIGEDHSTRDIGKMLEEKGLIRDGVLFILQELASEHRGEIKPGKYDLSTSMTAEEMITIMSGNEIAVMEGEEALLYNSDENMVGSDLLDDEELPLSYEEQDGNELLEDAEEGNQ